MDVRPTSHALTGDLTIFEVTECQKQLVAFLEGQDRASLDLSGLARVDAAGLQLILAAIQSRKVNVTGVTSELSGRLLQLGINGESLGL